MTQNLTPDPSSTLPPRVSSEDLRGKSDRLISHVDIEGTAVFETRLEDLRRHAVTPTEQVFMRNSYPLPPLTDLLDDTLGIVGLVEFPLMLEISGLGQGTTLETVMQCAGNGRAFFRDAQTLSGSPWQRGGVANVQFSGVWLRDVLRRDNLKPEAKFLTARGHDGDGVLVKTARLEQNGTVLAQLRHLSGRAAYRACSPTGPARSLNYEKSVPLEDALSHGFLARGMNGEALSRTHGGPLRFVMPGYFATVNVKWLSSLILTELESGNEAQQERYRMPDGEACWRMPLKSVVWSPLEGEVVRGPVLLSGAAWNDGNTLLERVEISLDRGQSWMDTQLETFSQRPQLDWPPVDPSSERFAWARWTLELDLDPGEHEVWSRAVDAAGNMQLLEGDERWNADGYEWSGVDKVHIKVE